MSQYQQFGATGVKPHRGTMILVLGILGLVACGALAPVAWIMGNADLKEMQAGRMDRSGEGATNAGRICGMIGTILIIVSLCLVVPLFIFLVVMGGAAGNM